MFGRSVEVKFTSCIEEKYDCVCMVLSRLEST
jgi:hypothetical protein